MKEDLLAIINNYGVMPQLEYYQTEVFELNEAIISYENAKDSNNIHHCDIEYALESFEQNIAEEIADNYVMLYQFPEYYYKRLECYNIAPYEFSTDNYENIEDILEYLKKFQIDVCKLTCEIAIAEEREQDYMSEYRYECIIELIDNIFYKLKSIQLYYKISDSEIEKIMKYKIERQLDRMKEGK